MYSSRFIVTLHAYIEIYSPDPWPRVLDDYRSAQIYLSDIDEMKISEMNVQVRDGIETTDWLDMDCGGWMHLDPWAHRPTEGLSVSLSLSLCTDSGNGGGWLRVRARWTQERPISRGEAHRLQVETNAPVTLWSGNVSGSDVWTQSEQFLHRSRSTSILPNGADHCTSSAGSRWSSFTTIRSPYYILR